jgi:hypothetical protein
MQLFHFITPSLHQISKSNFVAFLMFIFVQKTQLNIHVAERTCGPEDTAEHMQKRFAFGLHLLMAVLGTCGHLAAKLKAA